MSGGHLSKDFFELVKAIGESKSKQEEERIVVEEVALLKRRLQDGISDKGNKKRQKEFLLRVMYVEMLGHDASFGYIKAVELTASTNLLQKRVGYLCCSLTLSPSHEFRFMIINQLQRDLQSSNHLEVCSALMAVCKLVTVEMIPAVLPMIVDLLRHDADLVRKKAVMTIHRFHQLNPDSILDMSDRLRRTLCDKDPSVMGASLCILHDVASANTQEYKDLVPSFVSILKQIMEHRLPREFDYHRIPAPWIQIRLLKVLAILGQADQQCSEGMYEVLHDVMRRADTGINVGYAIIYECVRTVTTIYPNSTLLDAAAASISRFISSDNHNLKYLGVTGLAAIVKDHPRYATQHQMAVVDCLEDPDETLKRKTLDLLYRMTNPVNVEFICDKLTDFLRETTDVYLRTELVSRLTQCAERYAPSNAWYIQTMTDVFALGGDLVRDDVAHNLLRLIAEGSGEDDELDMDLRRDAVETYLALLDTPVLPDILVCVMAWVLGEYGYLSETMPLHEICERVCELADRSFQTPLVARPFVVTAVMKITAQLQQVLPCVEAMIIKYKKSKNTDVQQRCFEFHALLQHMPTMAALLPVDASCDDIEVDPNMAFLSDFVQTAVSNGAPQYAPPEESDDDDQERLRHGQAGRLNFAAYEKPEIPYAIPKRSEGLERSQGQQPWGPNVSNSMQGPGMNLNPATGPNPSQLPGPRRSVKNVWGPIGLNGGEEASTNESQSQGPSPIYGGSGAFYGQPSPQPPLLQHSGLEEQPREDQSQGEQEPDKRQKMASALFGGLPGAAVPRKEIGRVNGQANVNVSAPPRRSSKGSNLRPDVNSGISKSGDVDLLDMGLTSAPVPALAPVQSHENSDPFNMTEVESNLPTSFQFDGYGLVPFSIETPDFGVRWGGSKCEQKGKVSPTSICTLNDYMDCMQKHGFHPIQAIPQTNEAIAAGHFPNTELVCLVHTKLRSAGFLDVTVRTCDPRLTSSILDYLSQALH